MSYMPLVHEGSWATPCDTLCPLHTELDNAQWRLEVHLDRIARDASIRLDGMYAEPRPLDIRPGYRSYDDQLRLFERWFR